MVLIGIPKAPIHIEDPMPNVLFKSLTLTTVHGRRIWHTWEACEALVAAGKVTIASPLILCVVTVPSPGGPHPHHLPHLHPRHLAGGLRHAALRQGVQDSRQNLDTTITTPQYHHQSFTLYIQLIS